MALINQPDTSRTRPTHPGNARGRIRGLRSWATVALLALLGVCSATTFAQTASAASGTVRDCLGDRSIDGCASAMTIAHSSGEEGESELEEELEEGSEEAASAEVEAEETESALNGSPSAGSSGASAVLLSHLQLTSGATAALAHRLPAVSAIGFSFTLSAPAKVQVTLLRQVGGRVRTRWTVLPDTLALSLGQGHVTRFLKAHNRLTEGRYRLTVKPANGRSRAIYLSVRR